MATAPMDTRSAEMATAPTERRPPAGHLITASPHQPLARPSTAGYLYWGKLHHRAQPKIYASVTPGRCQRQGALEFYALKRAGAIETVREQFNTRSAEREDAGGLAERVSAGAIEQAGAPSPRFRELARNLAAAGVRARLDGGSLQFDLAEPEGGRFEVARPVPHPWLRERSVTVIGECKGLAEFDEVVEANTRLARMLDSQVPVSLRDKASEHLSRCVRALFDALVQPEHLRFGSRVLFGGRAVITPARDLRHDRVGIPEEIAWTLFGPLLCRELAQDEVSARSAAAALRLDEVMASSWVLIHRAPVVEPTGFLAFHTYREPGRVIRIPPLANHLMNADFDGDELAVFLPLTECGQREAGERLSIAAHLRRDPDLLAGLQPPHGARYGLALLGRTEAGLAEISQLAGVEVVPIDGLVGRASILDATQRLLEAKGEEATLDAVVRLLERGFREAKRSGISMPPFPPAEYVRGTPPESAHPAEWERYQEETLERLLARRDNDGSTIYPYLLVTLSGARGTVAQIPRYLDSFGLVEDINGDRVPIRHSLLDGMSAKELRTLAIGSRRGQARAVQELEQITRILWERYRPTGFSVLDRAMRSRHPGIVFARAAASGEVDPLTSQESRLFVGL
jgi:hypothetical protein